jgi:hypothetical protein
MKCALAKAVLLFAALSLNISDYCLDAHSQEETVLIGNTISKNTVNVKVLETALSSSTTGDIKITFAIVDSKKFHVTLAVPSDPTAGGSSLARFFADEHAMVALNGGFLRTLTPATPVGLLKFNGEIVNRLSTEAELGGVICIYRKTSQIKFVTPSDTDIIAAADDCVQAGPLLLAHGVVKDSLQDVDAKGPNKSFSTGRYSRSFLARNGKGDFLLGVTTQTSLYAVRQFMMLQQEQGGLGAVDAINLTGIYTAGLIIKGQNIFSSGRTDVLLPNAFIVK